MIELIILYKFVIKIYLRFEIIEAS